MSPREVSGHETKPGTVRWKVHFTSAPSEVYRALSTPLGRSRFWALSAKESDGVIHFIEPRGRTGESPIEEAVKDQLYVVRYFGRLVAFELAPGNAGTGTDLTLTAGGNSEPDEATSAGWVSLLLRLKASVDFGVDLRNHDADKTWWHGYAEGS
ncbi:MAG: hypothetical protein QOG10_1461 [Kribbellaceae bacterium]|jgi:uncharacterized protein YndB with AHSA1/START domain|nr:hypothetical protein [Kribbellaceae bacterium]